jgi:hypothetical protein
MDRDLSARSLVAKALIAQTVEHILGKNGVMGSNPIEGSRKGFEIIKMDF